MPTLSRGTIYNTLKAFVQQQILQEISIEDNEVRYDLNTKKHGHFKCNECGAIYDFGIEIDTTPTTGLFNFQVDYKNVYFKGICPKCLKQE